jgi:peptide/nickel transport system substrate-binding protein
MNRTDRAVIGGLVLVLVLVAGAIAGPSLTLRSAEPSATPAASGVAAPVPYREGIVGQPFAVNPLAARTQVDRDLVALTFSSLVRLDVDAKPAPDLAVAWTASDDAGSWTFQLRPDARWHDGTQLTSADVVFTVSTVTDPDYRGPGAGSWAGVTATAVSPTVVRMDLKTPIAAFLDLVASQPIAPKHLLGDTPPAGMADDPFGEAPIGSGPYAVVDLSRRGAVLAPPATVTPPAAAASGSALPGDPLATPRPTSRPTVATPALDRLEFRFFETAADLKAAFAAGELDAASGLSAADATALSAAGDARLLRYPSTTLTAIALNLRPSHVEFADEKVRKGLLEAIDRPASVAEAFGGLAVPADAPIPPTSWACDPTASPTVPHSAKAAAAALSAAKWTKAKDGWRPPGVKEPVSIELVVPEAAKSPVLHTVGEEVAAGWKALGLSVQMVEQDPATLVTDRLRTGAFDVAVVDIALGHDPDLYPIRASTQTRTGGANILGLQDTGLDKLLEAARKPAPEASRREAFRALQTRLASGVFLLPIAFADEVVVVRNRVTGPVVREVADGSERFWDVLTWRLASGR